jgi:antiviral helicase SKI2
VNAQKRDLQRQLDSLKNRQLGPQWKKTGEAIQRFDGLEKAMERLMEEKVAMGSWTDHVDQSIGFLRDNGFIQGESLQLTLKGILATEVNEGHPILLTEFYALSRWKGMSDEEWVMFLSAFLEQREEEGEEIQAIRGSLEMKERLYWLDETARTYEESEQKWCGERSVHWVCSTQWMEPMRDWFRGSASSEICQTYGFFEGNFYRSLLKLVNIVNEVMSMATYCEHVEVVDQMVRINEQMRRSRWTGESLYLQL